MKKLFNIIFNPLSGAVFALACSGFDFWNGRYQSAVPWLVAGMWALCLWASERRLKELER